MDRAAIGGGWGPRSGQPTGPVGAGRRRPPVALRALASREGLDLSQCYAYSDSNNDLPMLTVVGRPVAVNPDAQLRQAAIENRWPIYDFRARRLWVRYKLPALITGAAAAGVAVGAAGATIAAGEFQTIALTGAPNYCSFHSCVTARPTYEVAGAGQVDDALVPNMLGDFDNRASVFAGADGGSGQGFLTNGGDRIGVTRDGLMQIDRLLHQFFKPEHETGRYA